MGIMTSPASSANPIHPYDIGKVRYKADIQVVDQAISAYAGSRTKDIAKFMDYVDKLRVKSKVPAYLEILL